MKNNTAKPQDHPLKGQFGWDGDQGIGARFILQMISGLKTATAGPRELYSAEEIEKLKKLRGKILNILDKDGTPRCHIRDLEIFETTFGKPDPRLVAGEGFGTNADAFKRARGPGWTQLLQSHGKKLTDETVLLVEVFELVD